VRIAARLTGDALVIEIENPRSARATPGESTGLGLANARERLRLVYGERASLDLDLSAPDRAVTRLVVPQGLAAARSGWSTTSRSRARSCAACWPRSPA